MRFVIIANPRTGSSHLVNLLGGHPQVVCNGNIFKRSGVRKVAVFPPSTKLSKIEQKELIKTRKLDLEAFMEKIYGMTYGRACVGFKIFQDQGGRILGKILQDKNIRKVILYRDNVLANYSSALIAQAVEQWGVREGGVSAPSPLVTFDESQFVQFHNDYVGYYAKIMKKLNNTGQHFHLIRYVDINNPSLLGSLLSFIGVDASISILPTDQLRRQIKQNASNIVSRFENGNMVRKFCIDNGLGHWMEEGETSMNALQLNTIGSS